jgi:acyl carrier protein
MSLDLESLRALLVKVKPSLATETIAPGTALVADLGLDSLDLLQLGRHVQRTTGKAFVMDDWIQQLKAARPPVSATVSGLIAAIDAADGS